MSLRRRAELFDYVDLALMLLMAFLMLYPLWYVIIVSLNDNSVKHYTQLVLLPGRLVLDNYDAVFQNAIIVNGFLISVLRTVAGTVVSVFCCAAFAYGLTHKGMPGRKLMLTVLTITMFFGGGLIPSYLLWRALGLVNTFWLYIVPGIIGGFTVMVMKTYFISSVPASVEESARLDGANELVIFLRLVLPMATPMLATFALFAAVGHWNEWFTAEIFVQNRKLHPLATVLRRLIFLQEAIQGMTARGTRPRGASVMQAESVKMAAVVVSILPITLVYPFLQRHFVHGLMIGSLKE